MCNKEFIPYSSLAKYCSVSCAKKWEKEKMRLKKEKASERINISIDWLSKEESREAIKEQLREFMPKYIENKKITIKVSKWKARTPLLIAKKNLDTIFAKYIRNRDWNKCVICGSSENPNNWHFYTRSSLILRYDEINCNCQCRKCNILHEQDEKPYKDWMIKTYWQEKLDELYKLYKWPPLKLKLDWYLEKIEYYKNKLKDYEK